MNQRPSSKIYFFEMIKTEVGVSFPVDIGVLQAAVPPEDLSDFGCHEPKPEALEATEL